MSVLIGIALKSLLIAGLTLGLLAIMKRRSAAERSWIAHTGLVALVLLAFAPLVLPRWTVEAPALLSEPAPAPDTAPAVTTATPRPAGATFSAGDAPRSTSPAPTSLSPTTTAMAFYAVPAAILLLITLVALARLVALRARADVLVDGHWLSALARAQRRMGFKHGTALLTSNELASPISWGLMRPVILLNNRAVEASADAEAIIAHELAHVARMDWVKLLLARLAICLFWFNPLVWLLAREAHQLREETADDAVLAADIPDTDYAQLLVGVARHECPGLLLGAHGVAPSRNSLARRVARVLDGKSVRGPAAKSFALGVFVGSVLVAAPLAALTLAPPGSTATKETGVARAHRDGTTPYYAAEVPADLPSIIAHGVSTSVDAAVTAIAPASAVAPLDGIDGALAHAQAQREQAIAQAGQAIAMAQASGDRTRLAIHGHHEDSAIEQAIEMKAVGVTPEYIAAMRAAAPTLARLGPEDFVELKAVGVTPEFAREMGAAGLRNLSADDLVQARAVGVSGSYIGALAAAGVRGTLDDYVELRAVGVTPEYIQELRRSGYVVRDIDELVEMRATGITADQLRRVRSLSVPVPPAPPGVPDPDG
jgi:beta-lactamase regulating signal transducer with metallopeptidase domain